ncbi:MAG: hypothetical protein MUE51_10950 [Thermoleophilia bacterium]|jgi:hypothetical protein|nr:hypothetical protein [Thermoleophilia bacterium]
MAGPPVTVADLARDPLDVARGLPAWARGDADEAALATLGLSGRNLHARHYTCWVWSARTPDGDPAWILPVSAHAAEAFDSRGPALVLLRCLAAAVESGADAEAVSLRDWHGFALSVVPGADAEIAPTAMAEAHPAPARAALVPLPATVRVDGEPLDVDTAPRAPVTGGVADLAAAIWVHPVRVALAMAGHRQPPDLDRYPAEVVGLLRQWGLQGTPPEPDAPSLAIDDDPCPRRKQARRVLRRLLHMRKVGAQYHTEFDHMYRGSPPELRHDALEVGEALLRAGLLGEKPSVGQRHVYLRREALPAIHALIERGETLDPGLAAEWTAPPPGEVRGRPGR